MRKILKILILIIVGVAVGAMGKTRYDRYRAHEEIASMLERGLSPWRAEDLTPVNQTTTCDNLAPPPATAQAVSLDDPGPGPAVTQGDPTDSLPSDADYDNNAGLDRAPVGQRDTGSGEGAFVPDSGPDEGAFAPDTGSGEGAFVPDTGPDEGAFAYARDELSLVCSQPNADPSLSCFPADDPASSSLAHGAPASSSPAHGDSLVAVSASTNREKASPRATPAPIGPEASLNGFSITIAAADPASPSLAITLPTGALPAVALSAGPLPPALPGQAQTPAATYVLSLSNLGPNPSLSITLPSRPEAIDPAVAMAYGVASEPACQSKAGSGKPLADAQPAPPLAFPDLAEGLTLSPDSQLDFPLPAEGPPEDSPSQASNSTVQDIAQVFLAEEKFRERESAADVALEAPTPSTESLAAGSSPEASPDPASRTILWGRHHSSPPSPQARLERPEGSTVADMALEEHALIRAYQSMASQELANPNGYWDLAPTSPDLPGPGEGATGSDARAETIGFAAENSPEAGVGPESESGYWHLGTVSPFWPKPKVGGRVWEEALDGLVPADGSLPEVDDGSAPKNAALGWERPLAAWPTPSGEGPRPNDLGKLAAYDPGELITDDSGKLAANDPGELATDDPGEFAAYDSGKPTADVENGSTPLTRMPINGSNGPSGASQFLSKEIVRAGEIIRENASEAVLWGGKERTACLNETGQSIDPLGGADLGAREEMGPLAGIGPCPWPDNVDLTEPTADVENGSIPLTRMPINGSNGPSGASQSVSKEIVRAGEIIRENASEAVLWGRKDLDGVYLDWDLMGGTTVGSQITGKLGAFGQAEVLPGLPSHRVTQGGTHMALHGSDHMAVQWASNGTDRVKVSSKAKVRLRWLPERLSGDSNVGGLMKIIDRQLSLGKSENNVYRVFWAHPVTLFQLSPVMLAQRMPRFAGLIRAGPKVPWARRVSARGSEKYERGSIMSQLWLGRGRGRLDWCLGPSP
ncbi:MAG: hypothetical protein LBJ61_09960 [Deltaproteobacteria bacterium]|jgi:hypothetical protein|nr:hypothetical protein [Deltaproteobacteria bacterium]